MNPIGGIPGGRGMRRAWALGAALALAIPAPAPAQVSAQAPRPVLRVGGSTTLVPVIREAARQLQRKSPGLLIEVDPSTSQTGMDQLAEGRLDAALSGLPPPPALLRRGVRTVPLVLQAFVLVVHPEVPPEAVEEADWSALFTRPGQRWPGTDLPVRPILRPRGTATQRVFEQRVIPGRVPSPQGEMAPFTTDLLGLVARTPGAVGLAEYGQARAWEGRVRLLPWKGLACTPQAIKEGRYPLVETGALLYRPEDLSPPRREAVEALLTLLGDPDFQGVVLEGQLGQFPLAWAGGPRP